MSAGQWFAGLNHGHHDAACALARDGEIIVAVEQERVSRNKRAPQESPALALKRCLDFAGIELSDISAVGLGSDHDQLAEWLGMSRGQRTSDLFYDDPDHLFPADVFGHSNRPAVQSLRHHLAHGASAFWPSGFEQAAILVVDAMGEDSAGIIAFGDGKKIDSVHEFPIGSSLGFYYEAAALYTGLSEYDPGKLMGLAGYGEPTWDAPLHIANGVPSWVGVPENSARGRAYIEQRRDDILEHFRAGAFPHASGVIEDIMAYADFAASVQESLERAMLGLAAEAKRLTGARNLVLAGGVALNCTANGRIADSGLFEQVYIQPAAHDAGTAVGAALLVANQEISEVPSPVSTPYLGTGQTPEEIEIELQAAGVSYERLAEPMVSQRVADLLASGAIVAWHQGRAEFGPRALGARSLLADPRDRRSLVRLNQIKGREMWRPIAPSVLEERFDDWFAGSPNPHMLAAALVRPGKRPDVPAIVHVDGTARPQAVRRTVNRLYWDLISAFELRTGLPLVANTSLNLQDEPMSDTVADTLGMLRRAPIDAASAGPFLVLSQ